MQIKKEKEQYFFVDEAGDSTFYDRYGRYIVGKEGCSKILLLGFIKTGNPEPLRKAILQLHKEIKNDSYLKDIPSLKKSHVAFHAKDDTAEVREKVYKTIVSLDFKAEFIAARKIENIFKIRHKGKENLFYDDLTIKLFQNKLHLSENIQIYFAVRGNKTRQAPLEEAILTAKNSFETKHNIKISSTIQITPQSPYGEPCLQIIDYMCWAVQRAFVKGENRYYKFVESKVKFICDVYDIDKYPNNFYNKENPFSVNKISPL